MHPASRLDSSARPRILIVGFGDVGERLAPHLTAAHDVIALVRREKQATHAIALGCRPIQGDLSSSDTLDGLAGAADWVVHLAPPPSDGDIDLHTQNLLAALGAGNAPARLVYVSTTGVYGDCGGQRIDETRVVNPQTARARRRVDAEQQLSEWAAANNCRLKILRAPGIYAADRLPIARLRAGTPAIIASEDSYTNHIHADDLAQCIVAALHGDVRGEGQVRVYNAVDDSDLKMGDYFDLVADFAKLPRPPRLPRAKAESLVSPAMLTFMRESRRIDNTRLKCELGITLRYPTVSDLLVELSARDETHRR